MRGGKTPLVQALGVLLIHLNIYQTLKHIFQYGYETDKYPMGYHRFQPYRKTLFSIEIRQFFTNLPDLLAKVFGPSLMPKLILIL